MAATTDRDIVAQLTQSNKQLAEMNTTLTAQLKSVMETNNSLIKKLENNNGTSTIASALKKVSYADAPSLPKASPTIPEPHLTIPKEIASLDPNGYCWTHSFRVQVGHNSKS